MEKPSDAVVTSAAVEAPVVMEEALPARIIDIAKFEGKRVQLKGWLYNIRSSGKILFLQVRDGSGIIQAVMVKKEVGADLFNLAKGLGQEASIIVTGTVRAEERSSIGFEM
mgnify:CR=1 FL=1